MKIVIVGGGIVGLAVAWRATRRWPGSEVIVLEREPALAAHQTGHNSGVLHSGLYYRPGSLKARLCRRGKRAMQAFCDAHGVPRRTTGKLVLAVTAEELPRLRALAERGRANGVDLVEVADDAIPEVEPAARGLAGLHVRETGITDYGAVCRALAAAIEAAGGAIRTGVTVQRVAESAREAVVHTDAGAVVADRVVAAAGLWSDRLARRSGAASPVSIVAFRGEYRTVAGPVAATLRGCLYPVPDPRFPFLGVHLHPRLDGTVEAGPSAVLAFARDGYTVTRVRLGDLAALAATPGFARFVARHGGTGLSELARSVWPPAFAAAVRRLVPDLDPSDLRPAPAGVRAQALTPAGELLDDFALVVERRVVHVVNAPSPAATASLAIADHVLDRLQTTP